jgi:hypothetical protein
VAQHPKEGGFDEVDDVGGPVLLSLIWSTVAAGKELSAPEIYE